ncbi:MAG: hypothetical protein WCB27_24235 [Thermoguttaceae bacterium]
MSESGLRASGGGTVQSCLECSAGADFTSNASSVSDADPVDNLNPIGDPDDST